MTDRNDEYRPTNPADHGSRSQQPRGQGTQQSRVAEEWAGRDYGRSQVHGQQGLEREYGTSLERGYEQSRQGAPHAQGWTSGWEDDSDHAGTREWGQGRTDRFEYGRPQHERTAQHQQSRTGYRNPEAGSSRYSPGPEDYSNRDRQAGEGYGRSSGYGNPGQDTYTGSGYGGGASFVSPADTQLGHSGLGRQNYSGKGPKNYKRSDERITEDLCERLTQDHDIDASELEVRIADGTATLEGSVPQRWMKHRAEDLADACAGVRTVENRIRVQSADAYSGATTDTLASQNRSTGGGTTQNRGTGGTAH